jgi:hypothetical protein
MNIMADPIIEMKGSLKKIQLENMMIKKIRDELTGNIDNVHDVKIKGILVKK